MKTNRLSFIVTISMMALLMLAACGMVSPSIRKDISYDKNMESERVFDCAINAARDVGFTQIEFPDRKTGTFGAMIVGGGLYSASYQGNFFIDKNTYIINVNLQQFGALVPASQAELSKIIDSFQAAFRKQCGK